MVGYTLATEVPLNTLVSQIEAAIEIRIQVHFGAFTYMF
jgi:hypothetical protein